MVKHLSDADVGYQFVGEDIRQFGRNYVRDIYGTPSEVYDIEAFIFWQNYLTTIALSAFKWENLPAGIDPRAVEYILLNFGLGALFKDQGGHLFAMAAPSDNINMYYNPNKIILTSPNGQNWTRHCQAWASYNVYGLLEYRSADAAACFDNLTRKPLIATIRYFARRLASYDRTADVNVNAQLTPWIIRASETAKVSAQRLGRKLERKEQILYLNDAADTVAPVEVLTTEAPYVADKIFVDQKKILDNAITMLGADNSNTDKRERVQTGEAMSNNEQIMLFRNSRLSCRQEFADRCNVIFATNISVKWAVPHMAESGDMRAPELTGNDYEGAEIDVNHE